MLKRRLPRWAEVMKIGILPRWAIGYLAVFLLLAAPNAYSLLKLHQLGTATIPGLNADIRILDCQKRLVDSVLSQLRYDRKYLLMRDPGLHDRLIQARMEFHMYLGQGISIADTEAKKLSFRRIGMHQKRYEALVDAETAHPADTRYRRGEDEATDATLEELKRLEGYAREDVNLKMGVVNGMRRSALRIALASSGLTILCALVIASLVTKSITSPLRRLVSRTREIPAGVFRNDPEVSSIPEISELTSAFNGMCEKLAAVDKMKTDFLSMISHDLRTPLTTIREGTSLLLDRIGGDITEAQKRLLDILYAEENRLIGMVNSILDLSKMEAGMMTYAFDRGDIAPLIDQVVTEITPLAESKKIALMKKTGDDLPQLNMDGERMLQALRNLIGNAVKFTPKDGLITICARAANGGVAVSVEDTGPGIPASKLGTIFEKFSVLDPKSGTGLGLAIVKHIIDVHGGKVWVESGLAQGSRFTFTLSS